MKPAVFSILLVAGCGDTNVTNDTEVAPLRVGVSAIEITPTIEGFDDLNGNGVREATEPFDDVNNNGVWDPSWLAGFGNGRPAAGVHDPLWARALTIVGEDERVAVVSLDLIGLGHDEVERIRAGALEVADLTAVVVVTTHQHSGPDTIGFWGPSMVTSGRDAAYVERVIDASVAAIVESAEDLRGAEMVVGRGEAPQLTSDSRLPEVIDEGITTIAFRDDNGFFATLSAWGDHPESLTRSNNQVSSDFVHYLRDEIESEYVGATALFIPGALGGLINPMGAVGCPDADGNETCASGTFEKAEYVGRTAARAVINSLSAPLSEGPEDYVALARAEILLPVNNQDIVLAHMLGIFERTIYTPDGVLLSPEEVDAMSIPDILAGDAVIRSEVNRLEIGPVGFIIVPGELYPELWLDGGNGMSLAESPAGADFPDAAVPTAWQTALAETQIPVVVSNGNDAIGYIIPRCQYDAVAPFAYEPSGQYGEGFSLGAETAPTIADAVFSLSMP